MASLLLVSSPGCAFLLTAIFARFKLPEVVYEYMFLAAAVGFLVSPFLAIAALVVVHRSRGRLLGMGIASASLGIGALVIALWVAAVPNRTPHSPRSLCAANLRELARIVAVYHFDHDFHYPPSLGSLPRTYFTDWRCFQCPGAKAPRMTGTYDEQLCCYRYVYYPDDSIEFVDKWGMVLVFDKNANHHKEGINVAFINGRVDCMSREKLVDALSAVADNKDMSQATRDSVRKTLAEVLAEAPHKRESP